MECSRPRCRTSQSDTPVRTASPGAFKGLAEAYRQPRSRSGDGMDRATALAEGSATAIFPLALSVVRDEVAPHKLPGAMVMISGTLAFGSGLSLVSTGAHRGRRSPAPDRRRQRCELHRPLPRQRDSQRRGRPTARFQGRRRPPGRCSAASGREPVHAQFRHRCGSAPARRRRRMVGIRRPPAITLRFRRRLHGRPDRTGPPGQRHPCTAGTPSTVAGCPPPPRQRRPPGADPAEAEPATDLFRPPAATEPTDHASIGAKDLAPVHLIRGTVHGGDGSPAVSTVLTITGDDGRHTLAAPAAAPSY